MPEALLDKEPAANADGSIGCILIAELDQDGPHVDPAVIALQRHVRNADVFAHVQYLYCFWADSGSLIHQRCPFSGEGLQARV